MAGGGFQEQEIDKGVYDISFRGNKYTSSYKANIYLLYRAADIAYQNKAKYFAITRGISESSYTTPTHTETTINGNYAYSNTYGGKTYTKPSGHALVTVLNEKPNTKEIPAGIEVYDTLFLCKQMYHKEGILCGNLKVSE